MFIEVKKSMKTMLPQTENSNKEIEITKNNQMEMISLKSIVTKILKIQ